VSDKSKEHSAVDIIYELSDKIDLLSQKIDVIDTNLKLANNKISKLNKAINNLQDAPVLSNPGVTTAPSEQIRGSGKDGGLVIGKIKTFGRIADGKRRPIRDVLVKVYNGAGDIIKTRKTDSEGYWDVRLPAGRYGVEYIHKGFKPINLTVELTEDMDSFEVK
jgi:hypothetical protein